MPGPVNHPPAPVLEGAAMVGYTKGQCDQIKADFNLETQEHRHKPSRKNQDSHHVAQDAATDDLIDRNDALTVMLDSSSGGEHTICSRRQNARNCGRKSIPKTVDAARKLGLPDGMAGGGPTSSCAPTTFGELKEAAKGDLKAALQGRRKNGNKPMSPEEADIAAECLVMEAEKKMNEKRKKDRKKPVKDTDTVKTPGPCFADGTFIWQEGGKTLLAEKVARGAQVLTRTGARTVSRTGTCYTSLVEITIGAKKVAMSPFHRVCLADGSKVRADALGPGVQVDTQGGPRAVSLVKMVEGFFPARSFGCTDTVECAVGPSGLWVEMPDTGIEVIASVELQTL